MKLRNLVLGVALVALMAACGSKETETATTATATTATEIVEATPTEEEVAEPVAEAPKAEAPKAETKKQETKKEDPCVAKMQAFESFAVRIETAVANKSQGTKQLKECAALVAEAPNQIAAAKECKDSDAYKTRYANALLKVNTAISKSKK